MKTPSQKAKESAIRYLTNNLYMINFKTRDTGTIGFHVKCSIDMVITSLTKAHEKEIKRIRIERNKLLEDNGEITELFDKATDEICSTCGFPKSIKRKNIYLKNDIFSLMKIEDGVCEECKHQKSGWTIPSVYEHIRIMIVERKNEEIQTLNKDKEKTRNLILKIIKVHYKGDIREFLLSFGEFKDVDI